MKAEFESEIREAVSSCADDHGWANLAEIGVILRRKGVKYGKLSRFFENYKYLVETKIDHTLNPPAVYAKLIEAEKE